MGPVVGSSGGKNILIFLPTLLGIIQTFIFYSESKNSQKTNRISEKKTTIQFRKNLIQKNAIFFFFSVLVCILTLMCVAGNPSNSGKIGKIQKNRISFFDMFTTENKNSKVVKSVKIQPKKCLQNPPPQKKPRKIPPLPPHFKILGFFSGEKGCKDNFNLPPPRGRVEARRGMVGVLPLSRQAISPKFQIGTKDGYSDGGGPPRGPPLSS